MSFKPEDFRANVKRKVQDNAGLLTDADFDAFVTQAVRQRYSQDRAQVIVTDVAADGSTLLPLPVLAQQQNAPAVPVFEVGFSAVKTLEYPIGVVPPSYFLDSDWQYYQTPTGMKLLLLATSPANNELVRVTWTARHADDGSSVPNQDFEAVCDFASSLCAEALAARYAQTRDNTINADVVNYRTKSQEYLTMAKALRQRYFNALGVDEGGGNEQGPAIAMGNMSEQLGAGVDRLIHSKYTR